MASIKKEQIIRVVLSSLDITKIKNDARSN